jgi:membrane protease YdiL (CAAX protease family)
MSRSLFAAGSVALAFVLWYFAFALRWGNFWLKIAFSAALLATVAWIQMNLTQLGLFTLTARDLYLGVGSVIALYLVFWVGRALATRILPFSHGEIENVYARRGTAPVILIALLLFFVTGPSEEIYWRGGLQTAAMGFFGPWSGWLAASALYALVHIWTKNFTLIMAALIAGLFWGFIYLQTGSLTSVIISHSLWSVTIFAIWPLR